MQLRSTSLQTNSSHFVDLPACFHLSVKPALQIEEWKDNLWHVVSSCTQMAAYHRGHTSHILFNTMGNCYTIIHTMLLFLSLKDNNKKIILPNIVALLVLWISNKQCFQPRVWSLARALFHDIENAGFKILAYECCSRKKLGVNETWM